MQTVTPLPSLEAIRAFLYVARSGSFTDAAAALGLSQAAVSYAVSRLEKSLGVPLLVRSRPRAVLTDAGRVFAGYAEGSLEQLELGQRAVRRHGAGRIDVLRINVMEAFAILWLVPRLRRFQTAVPGAQVAVTSWIGGAPTEAEALLERDEVHACITFADPRDAGQSFAEQHLAFDFVVPVCSPAAAPHITCVPDLTDHVLLHALTAPRHWGNWLRRAGHPGLKARGELRLQHSALCVQAAMNGLGVAMAHTVLAAGLLRTGTLVAPLGTKLALRKHYAFICLRNRADDPVIRAFGAWLHQEIAEDAMAQPLAGMTIL